MCASGTCATQNYTKLKREKTKNIQGKTHHNGKETEKMQPQLQERLYQATCIEREFHIVASLFHLK